MDQHPQENTQAVYDIVEIQTQEDIEKASNQTPETLVIHFQNLFNNIELLTNFLSKQSIVKDIVLDFSYIFYLQTEFSAKVLADILNPLKELQTCKVSFRSTYPSILTKETITTLFSSLSTEIKSLIIDFSTCKELKDEVFINVGSSLSNLKNVETLNLDFSHSSATDQALTYFYKGINEKSAMKSLSLNFSKCKEFGKNSMGDLSQLLNNSPNLQEFVLRTIGCEKMEDESFFTFVNSLCTRPLLSLILDFNDCPNITDLGLESLGTELKSCSTLKKLVVMVASPNVGSNGVGSLIKGIEKLNSLKSLVLGFQLCTELDSECFRELEDSFEKISYLEEFCLDLEGCSSLSEKNFEYIGKGLSKMKHLKILTLNFAYCPISKQDLKFLNAQCKTVEMLNLSFKCCEGEEDENSGCFNEWLEELENLKNFTLNLAGSPEWLITIDEICKGLRGNKAIKEVNLDFSEGGIREESFCHFETLMESVKDTLTKLVLKIRETTVTDKEMELLGKVLIHGSGLKYLTLDLSGNENLGKEGIEKVIEVIEKLSGLEYLEINVMGCKRIPEEGTGFEDKLNEQLPNCSIVYDE